MSFVTASGYSVAKTKFDLPGFGVGHALVDIPVTDAPFSVNETVDLVIDDNTWSMTCARAEKINGATYRCKLVQGKNKMNTVLNPKQYRNARLSFVLSEAFKAAGEDQLEFSGTDENIDFVRFSVPAHQTVAGLQMLYPDLRFYFNQSGKPVMTNEITETVELEVTSDESDTYVCYLNQSAIPGMSSNIGVIDRVQHLITAEHLQSKVWVL